MNGGKFDAWVQVGSSYRSPFYVTKYRNHSEGKQKIDHYAYTYFSDYYKSRNTTIQEELTKWRFGIPKQTSAYRNVMRYRMPIVAPLDDDWANACAWTQDHFRFMGESTVNWDLEYIYPQLNNKSSPGFPYSRGYHGSPPFPTKEDLFKWNNGKYAQNEFAHYVSLLSDVNYKCGEWYTLSAKKELRKVKKILADDFRAYTAASWRNTCAGIAMCGDMCQKFYASWATSAAFVGGSTFHGCWNILFQRLNKHPNAFECDVSAWDATLSAEMIESFREIMWSFIRDSDKTHVNNIRFKNLFREIHDSMIICPNGDVFVKTQGNPSGSFLTIVTNTIIHYALFCYAWLQLAPEEFNNLAAFKENVELALCGDDSLFTVSNSVVGFFNVTTIIQVWRSLGIAAKIDAVAQGKLVERNFLSQQTRKIGKCYLPYPDCEKVISSLIYHTHADVHIRWSYLKAAALRLSSFWNPQCREMLNGYLLYLERSFPEQLRDHCTRKGWDMFTWEEVQSVYKSDRELAHLYMSVESSQMLTQIDHAGLKLCFQNVLQSSEEEEESGCESS